jgi:hypothetical protein
MVIGAENAICTQCGRRFLPDREQRSRSSQARRNGWTIRLYCPADTQPGRDNWVIILPGPG